MKKYKITKIEQRPLICSMCLYFGRTMEQATNTGHQDCGCFPKPLDKKVEDKYRATAYGD